MLLLLENLLVGFGAFGHEQCKLLLGLHLSTFIERRLGLLLLLNRGTRENNARHPFFLLFIPFLTGIHHSRNSPSTHHFDLSAFMHQPMNISLVLLSTPDQW